MFVNKLFTFSRAYISKSKRCFNVKSSTYYFHMKTKLFADFQIYISVPLKSRQRRCFLMKFSKILGTPIAPQKNKSIGCIRKRGVRW